nr:D-alanyl-D-alanine carboxypeptidase family protein [Oceaniovalibus guishaninsula]
MGVLAPHAGHAQPYAALVIDARSGQVLHETNADARLHPASLTKMMTLYLAFQAVERGEITMDTLVTVSSNAAKEPPSKLGLRAGQKIALRYLVRAAAVKSANDAATAIGEAISGSEQAFAARMTATAQSLGMTRTTFKNANGLTREGHLSTARDMTLLGRRLFWDYPQYYNLFSRTSTDAGIAPVNNTNRRLLAAYKGADGIKTGYTSAAGFNLVASAERGCERVIATVFGGRSTAQRNAKVAELMDLGFSRITSCAAAPQFDRAPRYDAPSLVASAVRVAPVSVASTARPAPRPGSVSAPMMAANAAPVMPGGVQIALASAAAPVARPEDVLEVVTRVSTSGGRHWGINLGRFGSKSEAERILLKTALVEIGTLDDALRKVVPQGGGYDANFVGMSEEMASLACRRLSARNMTCSTLGPG